jgi:WD40 repeat protein
VGPGVRVWDVASGKEVRTFGRYGAIRGRLGVSNLAVSADGKTLAVGNDRNTVQQWDLSTGKELLTEAGHQGPVTAVGISADGKTVATRGLDDTVRFWNSATGSALVSIRLPAEYHRDVFSVAFAANDRVIVQDIRNNSGFHANFDVKTGKPVSHWELERGVTNLAISPDGKTVASRWCDGVVLLHDAPTGKIVRQLQDADPPNGPHWEIDSHSGRLAFSPDGSTLAVAALGQEHCTRTEPRGMLLGLIYEPIIKPIVLYDVNTGRQRRPIDTGKRVVSRLAFSPDSRALATLNQNNTITLWEMATGKERFSFPSKAGHTLLTFAPDGRALFAAGEAPIIHAYSAWTGREVTQFKGHGGPITALAVREKILVSASKDTTALVWNLAEFNRELPAVELVEAQAEALWHDLASADAGKAYDAIRTMSAAPRQVVPLLRERVKPVQPPDAKKLARLIADLDSDKFAVRQQANTELARMGDLAAIALQNTLDDGRTLETRRRIERLLEKLVSTKELPADLLRALRALEVLEQINTPEARQAVERVASGAPGTLLTRKARETLNRMR